MAGRGITDTSAEVAARQRELLRASSLAQRAAMIEELCAATTAIALAGIDEQHPLATASERTQLLAARRYGRSFSETELGRMLAR